MELLLALGLMVSFPDDFDPFVNAEHLVEACKIASKAGVEDLTEDQSSMGLVCLSMLTGAHGLASLVPKVTAGERSACVTGGVTPRVLATKLVATAHQKKALTEEPRALIFETLQAVYPCVD